MLRKIVLALSLVLLAFCPVLAQEKASAAKPRNIILIGWDGAQRAHVMECLERGELPNLKQLSQEGALVNIDVVTGATDTKAGWTQILTGYNPEVTGVYSNGRYRDVPKGLSIFERLKEHFGPDFVCVAVIGKREHCGEIREPFKRQLTDEEAAKIQAQQEAAAKAKQAQGAKKQAAQPGAAQAKPAVPA
ncbi:MAG TPA: alkaline phosphatase family protein, partial [Thermogutta sp.]|nr:alkaline phosphatase family protein [Thermogutta sp.]